MSTLTDAQIAQLAIDAGFPSTEIAHAVAIALAESGGRTDAVGHNTNGSTDTGLWQINSVHGIPQDTLLDAKGNAKAAHTIWSQAGNSWSPWTTFTRGTYLAFMGRGNAAAAHPDSSAGGSSTFAGQTATTAADTTKAALDKITFGGFWLRVGAGLLGTVLFVMAIMRMMGVNQTIVQFTKTAAKTAIDAAPELAAA